MSKFFEELWESIFTPGPTPSLLIATNVTFAVLQVVLFVLLVATYSIHFVVLSILSAGLWWAINWFARELQVARALQDEQDEEEKRKQRRRAAVAAATASPVSTDSETEVDAPQGKTATGRSVGGSAQARKRTQQQQAAASQVEEETDGAAPALAAPVVAGAAVAATASALGSQDSNSASISSQRLSSRSGVSTEDEWEKVSENEQ